MKIISIAEDGFEEVVWDNVANPLIAKLIVNMLNIKDSDGYPINELEYKLVPDSYELNSEYDYDPGSYCDEYNEDGNLINDAK